MVSKTKILKLSIFFVLLFYVFHFFFFWIFESTDSFFYFQLADFIKTGKYFAPYPYNYTVPSTMEPPLYSVFLFLFQFVKRADVLIHFVQLLSILISSYIIYRIFKKKEGSKKAMVASIVFLLVPAHFIYSSNLVAEPIAIGFISIYLYISYLILVKKKFKLIDPLLIFSTIMALQRYNLLLFFAFAFLLFLIYRRKKITSYLYLSFSIAILLSWILMNHFLNGSWGMSNAEGKHLYNRVLHFDRLLPDESNSSFEEFKSIVGEDIDYFKPWWFYESMLVQKLGSETASSNLMRDVALAALVKNPVKFVLNTPGFFLFAHGENHTYHDPLYLWKGTMAANCRQLGNAHFCTPLIKAEFAKVIWDKMVGLVDWYYLNVSKFVNYFLLFPALIYVFLRNLKNKFFFYVGLLYFTGIMFFVLVEAPLPRYTYNFTPLKIILIFHLLFELLPKIRKEWKKLSR